MPTALESFIRQDGRDDLIEQVQRKIADEGITYVYFQFVSVTGRIMGKGIPADHWASVAVKGFQLVYGATANLFIDRHDQYIGYGPEARELVGLPDVETFSVLPWDPKVARVFCTLFRGREETTTPAVTSPRIAGATCAGCTSSSPPTPACICGWAASPR